MVPIAPNTNLTPSSHINTHPLTVRSVFTQTKSFLRPSPAQQAPPKPLTDRAERRSVARVPHNRFVALFALHVAAVDEAAVALLRDLEHLRAEAAAAAEQVTAVHTPRRPVTLPAAGARNAQSVNGDIWVRKCLRKAVWQCMVFRNLPFFLQCMLVYTFHKNAPNSALMAITYLSAYKSMNIYFIYI